MIYLYLSDEINILKRNIDELILKLNISNIIKYDFDNTSINEILNEVNYCDLFNDKKIIIVSNFSMKKIHDKDEKLMLKYIDNMSDNVIVFKCIDSSLDERKKITKKLREKCKVIIVEPLDYKSLEKYVIDLFSKENKKISSSSIKKILELCQYNTDYTLNEVDKLLLYKIKDNEISEEDIDLVVSKNPEKEIFNLVSYVMKKNIPASFNSLKILLSCNIDSVYIIDSLAKQFRILYQVKLLSKDMNSYEITSRLGENPYVIKKSLSNINNYKEEEILNILYKLSDTDRSIKIDGIEKNKALENFFISL